MQKHSQGTVVLKTGTEFKILALSSKYKTIIRNYVKCPLKLILLMNLKICGHFSSMQIRGSQLMIKAEMRLFQR